MVANVTYRCSRSISLLGTAKRRHHKALLIDNISFHNMCAVVSDVGSNTAAAASLAAAEGPMAAPVPSPPADAGAAAAAGLTSVEDAAPRSSWPPIAGSPFALRVAAAEPCLRETLVVVAGAAAGGLTPPAEGRDGDGGGRCRCGTFRVELHDRFRNRCIGAKAMRLLQIEVCVCVWGGGVTLCPRGWSHLHFVHPESHHTPSQSHFYWPGWWEGAESEGVTL